MRARENRRQRLLRVCLTGSLLLGAMLTVVGAAAVSVPLKIGFVATFSGPGGVIGTELYDGFMLGVDHANGKLGGLDTEVLQVDDQLKLLGEGAQGCACPHKRDNFSHQHSPKLAPWP